MACCSVNERKEEKDTSGEREESHTFLSYNKHIFGNVSPDMGQKLFADDGVLWNRKKLQEGITQVEIWGKKWDLHFQQNVWSASKNWD